MTIASSVRLTIVPRTTRLPLVGTFTREPSRRSRANSASVARSSARVFAVDGCVTGAVCTRMGLVAQPDASSAAQRIHAVSCFMTTASLSLRSEIDTKTESERHFVDAVPVRDKPHVGPEKTMRRQICLQPKRRVRPNEKVGAFRKRRAWVRRRLGEDVVVVLDAFPGEI